MVIIELLGILGIIVAVLGSILAAKKSVHCWPVWIVGCLIWIGYAIPKDAYCLILQQVIFIGINLYGWYKWK